MTEITTDYIRNRLAKSPAIFTRGENIFLLGNYSLKEADHDTFFYRYAFAGNYGDYEVLISPDGANASGDVPAVQCSCPYPHRGCKHAVAAFLDIAQRLKRTATDAEDGETGKLLRAGEIPREYLTPEEIREIALESRRERAKKEPMTLVPGEMFKGHHLVRGEGAKEYTVTIYSSVEERGHCSCPDFGVNHLDTCKHLIFVFRELSRDEELAAQAPGEIFPYVHIIWNSRLQNPSCFYESVEDPELAERLDKLFSDKGVYTRESLQQLFALYSDYSDRHGQLLFDPLLLKRMDELFFEKEAAALAKKYKPDYSFLKTELYPYQKEGILFSAFRKSAIIADEMGLGKTLQAITAALLKREIFGIRKCLIISPSSVKSQWKREIEKFTDETALIISGPKKKRSEAYREESSFFKITNYEALMRDIGIVRQWSPDFVILDEAQRIKNFETKTHQAISRIPHSHALVMTGTPLENKLEDLYGIVQFADPGLLTPLWAFAANHYSLSKGKKGRILGYRNLDMVHEKMKPLLIRRTKKEVFESLPEVVENTYYLDLSDEQREIHHGYMQTLLRIISKKFLTPMDLKMIQKVLLCMRMVCNSTFLIDKKSNISPKLVELVSILKEIVVENRRKVIIFTEWTGMTYLVGKVLSELGINFVEFSGKVPTEKRQLLIDEFRDNTECMVFLSTDAGGVGLNLQNTDCLINMELPWNPAKLNQRIGRIHRIGQKSSKINIINMISRNSIEEKVYAGIGLKQELFDAVIDGAGEEVDFSHENKNRFVEELRNMFNEELAAPSPDPFVDSDRVQPELDEKTPHYLNPEILKERDDTLDLGEEELSDSPRDIDSAAAGEKPRSGGRTIPPEELEAVLNQGLAFLNTLTQAATGKALFDPSGERKSVEIDRETGEVVLRFKL